MSSLGRLAPCESQHPWKTSDEETSAGDTELEEDGHMLKDEQTRGVSMDSCPQGFQPVYAIIDQ